jgi:hypothetical protein
MAKSTLRSGVGIFKGLLGGLPELSGSGKGSHTTTKTVTKDITRTHQVTQTVQIEIERKWTITKDVISTHQTTQTVKIIVSKNILNPQTTWIPATTTATATVFTTITSTQTVQQYGQSATVTVPYAVTQYQQLPPVTHTQYEQFPQVRLKKAHS